MNRYVLDANVFIQAKNDHYGMDFCPAFWDWLVAANALGQICSIKAVYDELTQTADADGEDEDDLSKWVKSQGNCLFRPQDQDTLDQLPAVASWAQNQQYTPDAIHAFLSCADMHIVAFALAHQHTVVTPNGPPLPVSEN